MPIKPEKNKALTDAWVYFMRHIMELGWLMGFERLGKEGLVVADAEFTERMHKAKSGLKCHFVAPEDLEGLDVAGYEKVLVFVRQGESELIASLKAAYPNLLIVSGIHEFSMVSSERAARTVVLRTPPKDTTKAPLVFLGTPNSGAEYFAKVMGDNGFLRPWEYIGRPFITMSELYTGIDFDTLIKVAEERYRTDEGMAYLFNTDVLNALFENTSLTPEHFNAWLKSTGAKVVTFKKEDKGNQAAMTGLLKPTFTRSVWTMRNKPAFKFKVKQSELKHIYSAFFHLLDGEALLEQVTEGVEGVLHLEHSDIASSAEDSFDRILSCLGLETEASTDLPAHSENYWLQAEGQQTLLNVRADMIDRFGLF